MRKSRLGEAVWSHSVKFNVWIQIWVILESKSFFFFFPFPLLCCVACRILALQQGMKPMPPALEAWSLNHWATREVPRIPEFLTILFWSLLFWDLVLMLILTSRPHMTVLPPWAPVSSLVITLISQRSWEELRSNTRSLNTMGIVEWK